MNTIPTHNPNKVCRLGLHRPVDCDNILSLLNGLSPDELVQLGLTKGPRRHDQLGLNPSKAQDVLQVSARTEYLVRRFARQHCLTMVAAFDILLWSGLQYRHGQNSDLLPVTINVPVLTVAPDDGFVRRGRPKTGLGQSNSIRLTSELENRLHDYGAKYGNLIRKWMKQYLDNPVPLMDCHSYALDNGRNDRPQLKVSFLKWQQELLKEVELAFGCTRSQALLKILVAVGVA